MKVKVNEKGAVAGKIADQYPHLKQVSISKGDILTAGENASAHVCSRLVELGFADEVKPESAGPKTKADFAAELTARGIEFDASDNKEFLVALYEEAIKDDE